jgi:hypothetical protein
VDAISISTDVASANVVVVRTACAIRNRREDAVSSSRITGIVRAFVVVVAINRKCEDTLSVHARVGRACVVIVADVETLAAIVRIGFEVRGDDRVAMSQVGRHGALVDLDHHDRVLRGARAVADGDLVVLFLSGNAALVTLAVLASVAVLLGRLGVEPLESC